LPGATYGHQVAGRALISVSCPDTPSVLDILGYSEDGVKIAFTDYHKDIHGDQNGGQAGPAVDVLCCGRQAVITIDLIDYTKAVLVRVLKAKNSAGTTGVPESAGLLLLAGSKYVRVCINAANDPFNFPYCELLDGTEFNVGTNETVYRLTFRAHVPSINGALWNTTVS